MYCHCYNISNISTMLSGNICIIPNRPVYANKTACIIRVLSFRMHVTVSNVQSISKEFFETAVGTF